METTKLKSFATRARKLLIEGVYKKMRSLGFDENGQATDFPRQISGATLFKGEQLEESFYDRWLALYEALKSKGVREVCENVAYTWFNRFMAIRILYKNGFIAPVLTFDHADIRVPHIVTEARNGRFPNMENKDRMRLLAVINDASKTYEQFNILIVAVCHSTPLINNCFGAINDYTELLLPRDILDVNGFIDMLNNSDSYITEENYRSTELLGWLYQFYISDRKDEVFAKKGKYNSEDIAPATQIFTPNWIVKYMVQNAVLPQIMSREELEENKEKYKYLVLPENNEEGDSQSQNQIQELRPYDEMRIGDLACGSGHILIECFNVMLEPLTQQLWSKTEAIKHMFEYTLIGIDIDTRAKQLATFALLLRACQEDQTFLDGEIMPRILDIAGIADFVKSTEVFNELTICPNQKVNQEIEACFKIMEDVVDLGSIMKFDVSPVTREWIESRKDSSNPILNKTYNLILALTEKYDALIMNPPYMGSHSMPEILKSYVDEKYPLTANDLGAVFLEVALSNLKRKCSTLGMINQAAWLFKPSYKSFREEIIDKDYFSLTSLLYLGAHTFDEIKGEVVQSVCFVAKPFCDCLTSFYYLAQFPNSSLKSRGFLEYKKPIQRAIKDFALLNGKQFGFWLNQSLIEKCNQSPISLFGSSKQGLKTGDNSKFIRFWHEVSSKTINKKWFYVETGGSFRKWYGNHWNVIEWENDGYNIKNFKDRDGRLKSRPQGLSYAFTNGLTWSTSAADNPSFRYSDNQFLFESSGSKFFCKNEDFLYVFMAFFNTPVSKSLVEVFSPGIGISEGAIKLFPFILSEDWTELSNKSLQNLEISKSDWDGHEISWDFQENPIIYWTKKTVSLPNPIEGEISNPESITLKKAVSLYKGEWKGKYLKLQENEEELNRRFIEIYGLEEELSPIVPYRNITILQQGELDVDKCTQENFAWNDDVLMKQLISYAIACMMGRYRLDKPGLAIAHPNPTEEELAPYSYNGSEFIIDDDAIIPIMPEDCPFDDNASIRISDFIGQVFGSENQIDSLNFMEQALGKTISEYMLRDFWKDHKKIYQNRPIYWLFSSKGGAFKVLVYMHRMDPFTVNKIRNNYLLRHIEYLKQKIEELKVRQANLSREERSKLSKMQADLVDCQEYEIRLHAVANKQIDIDLDNGVIANYALFGDVLAKIK